MIPTFIKKTVLQIRLFFATGCYAGFAPSIPGTLGTLVAVPIFLLVGQSTPIHLTVLWVLLLLAFPLGDWAEGYFKKKDPQPFVLDEIVGYLIAVLNVPWDIQKTALAGFLLFRFFDVIKPMRIRRIQNLSGGAGIVMDDILAGVYANLILQVGLMVFPQ